MTFRESWGKFELYILSLWFLFFLIIVVTVNIPVCFEAGCEFIGLRQLLSTNIVALTAAFFLCTGVLSYVRFDYRTQANKKLPQKISEIEDLNYEHLTFLTTYIIPLICFNLTDVRYLLALGLLLIVIGVIYVKTDKFYANPTLAVLGFRLYKVNLESRTGLKTGIVIITRDPLANGDQVRSLELDDKVYFGRKV